MRLFKNIRIALHTPIYLRFSLPVKRISAFPVKGQSELPISRYPPSSMVMLPDVSLASDAFGAKDAVGAKTNLPPFPMTTLLRRSVSVSNRIGSFISIIPSAGDTYNKFSV